jgi:hypothetical protein
LGSGIQVASPEGVSANPVTLIASIVQFLLYAGALYFGVRYGRRLAWNRNRWTNFAAFELSERRWMPWGIVFAALTAIGFIMSFFS